MGYLHITITCPDCAGQGDYCRRCFGSGEVEVFSHGTEEYAGPDHEVQDRADS